MPLPVIPGVVRATFRGNLPSGTEWANVLHFRYAGGASTPGSIEITALHNIALRLWSGTAYSGGSAWFAYCPASVTLVEAVYYKLDGSSPPEARAISAAGAGAGNIEPPEVAHVLTVRTGTRGRSYRGRVYLPAVVVSNLTSSGLISPTAITAIQNQWTGMQAALTGAQWSHGVASYLRSVFTDAIGVSMDPRPDVQRRRKR